MWIEYVLNGKRKLVKDVVGKRLIKVKAAREVQCGYITRDMADQPNVLKIPDAVIPSSENDGLDTMEKADLHALAKGRGVKVHHMAGAEKVRAALRGESQE